MPTALGITMDAALIANGSPFDASPALVPDIADKAVHLFSAAIDAGLAAVLTKPLGVLVVI